MDSYISQHHVVNLNNTFYFSSLVLVFVLVNLFLFFFMLSCANKEVLLILLCENPYQCIKIQQNLYLYHQNVQRIEPVWKAFYQRELDHSVTRQRMWVLSCLGNWHVNTESGVSENKVKVERASGSKNSLCISRTHCSVSGFFRESVLEGFGNIIHSAGLSLRTTHTQKEDTHRIMG